MTKFHRRSVRLKGYDYSQSGHYFVTICTHDRECLFGDIIHTEIKLNEIGNTVKNIWHQISYHYNDVILDTFQIMPNHLHGILIISIRRGEACLAPTLGNIVGSFKSECTKQIHKIIENSQFPIWQRNYYEHIIRNEIQYWAIRKYIQDNPKNWDEDELNQSFLQTLP